MQDAAGSLRWLIAWPRRRLGFYPKGSQRQADARGWADGVAKERGNPLELGDRGPASPHADFLLKSLYYPVALTGLAQGVRVGAKT